MADHQTIQQIQETIEKVLLLMGVNFVLNYEDSLAGGLVFNIRSRDAKLLIGQQGANLYALEHILHSIVAKKLYNSSSKDDQDHFIRFSIDIDDYKKNKLIALKQIVKNAINDLKRTGRPVSLPNMLRRERRFVHTYIQEQYPHITTESSGYEPHRYIKLSL